MTDARYFAAEPAETDDPEVVAMRRARPGPLLAASDRLEQFAGALAEAEEAEAEAEAEEAAEEAAETGTPAGDEPADDTHKDDEPADAPAKPADRPVLEIVLPPEADAQPIADGGLLLTDVADQDPNVWDVPDEDGSTPASETAAALVHDEDSGPILADLPGDAETPPAGNDAASGDDGASTSGGDSAQDEEIQALLEAAAAEDAGPQDAGSETQEDEQDALAALLEEPPPESAEAAARPAEEPALPGEPEAAEHDAGQAADPDPEELLNLLTNDDEQAEDAGPQDAGPETQEDEQDALAALLEEPPPDETAHSAPPGEGAPLPDEPEADDTDRLLDEALRGGNDDRDHLPAAGTLAAAYEADPLDSLISETASDLAALPDTPPDPHEDAQDGPGPDAWPPDDGNDGAHGRAASEGWRTDADDDRDPDELQNLLSQVGELPEETRREDAPPETGQPEDEDLHDPEALDDVLDRHVGPTQDAPQAGDDTEPPPPAEPLTGRAADLPPEQPRAAETQHKEKRRMRLPWQRKRNEQAASGADALDMPPPPEDPPAEDEAYDGGRPRKPWRRLIALLVLLLVPALAVIYLYMTDPRDIGALRGMLSPNMIETAAVILGHPPSPIDTAAGGAIITPPSSTLPATGSMDEPARMAEPDAGTESAGTSLPPADTLPPLGSPTAFPGAQSSLPATGGVNPQPGGLPPVEYQPFSAGTAAQQPTLRDSPAGQPAQAAGSAASALRFPEPGARANAPMTPADTAPASSVPAPPATPLPTAMYDSLNTISSRIGQLDGDVNTLAEQMQIVLGALPPDETVQAARIEDIEHHLRTLQGSLDILLERTLSMDAPLGDPDGEPPAKPERLSAFPGTSRVTLSWQPPRDSAVTMWLYSYRMSDGPWSEWQPIPGSNALTNSHTVSELLNGTPYDFKVRAVHGAAEGEQSDVAQATPGGAPAMAAGTGTRDTMKTDMNALVVRPGAVDKPMTTIPGRVYRAPRARYAITSRIPPDLGNLEKGDFLPGYGRVLHVIRGAHGKTVVTENGSLFDPEPIEHSAGDEPVPPGDSPDPPAEG